MDDNLSMNDCLGERDFVLAELFYEELNKRPATDMELEGNTNFDIKIGYISKEMVKTAKSDSADNGNIDFFEIVDLLKSLLELTEKISTLKCEIVLWVFEYLTRSELKDFNNCEIIPKITDIVFIKYLRKKEFENPATFCKVKKRS